MKPNPRPFTFDEMYDDIEGLDFSEPDYRDIGESEVDRPYEDEE